MTRHPKQPVMLVGLFRIREHCTFTWQEPEGGGQRAVEIVPSHCAECVAEIRKRGYRLVYEGGMDPESGENE
jgi:hypothetical protein